MGIEDRTGKTFDGGRIAANLAQPRLKELSDYAERRAAALAAGAATIIFVFNWVTWTIRWGGIPAWHAWFDQGQYLKSARAFAALDFRPELHLYPPLYPALAAPFTVVIPNDPFAIINALCLAASTAMLVDMFAAAIGSRAIAALFAVGFLLLPGVTFETFVIPWTSTAATFLIIAGLFLLSWSGQDGKATPRRSFLFGLALGLLVPTRPLDAVVALTLVPPWIVCAWRGIADRRGTGRIWLFAVRGAIAGSGAAVGPAILLASNKAIHGAAFSPYMDSSIREFAWNSVPAKFVSIFFDSAGLFVEPSQTLMTRFPWLMLAAGAMVACSWCGPAWLRAAAVLVAAQFACYLAYVDLLPNGLYRYLNYHYFRWALWLAFLMLPAAAALLYRRFGWALWRPAAVLAIAAMALAGLQFRTREAIGAVDRQDGSIAIDLPRGGRIDYVDVIGLTADWQHTYFSDPRMLLDGHPVQGLDRLRALQTATGTRFLFLQPIDGGHLQLPDANWTLNAPSVAAYGRYGFALGLPKWLAQRFEPLRRGIPLRLDGPIADRMFARGFAPFDGRGRAIEAGEATLRLGLAPRPGSYRVRLVVTAGAPAEIAFRPTNAASPAPSVEVDSRERMIEVAVPPAALSMLGWPTAIYITTRMRGPSGNANAPTITTIEVD